MAFTNQGPYDTRPMRASSNVSALTYSGNPPAYSSGGLPFGVAVAADTGTGLVGDCTLPSAVGAKIVGIAQTYPAAGTGDSVDVAVRGTVKCLAAGAIAIDDLIEVADNTGKVQTARSATATFLLGRAVTAAVGAGDYVSVELNIGSKTTTP